MIAHEYEFGSGDHVLRAQAVDWFRYQVGMHSFRAFAQGKATWILNYSWEATRKGQARAMMNLAMSQVMAGANFWDASGHSIFGQVQRLCDAEEDLLVDSSSQKRFICLVGRSIQSECTFRRDTRNFYADDFIASYRGILILLMQKHLEFQIVTPRTLADFHGQTLVLPDVRVLRHREEFIAGVGRSRQEARDYRIRRDRDRQSDERRAVCGLSGSRLWRCA